MDTLPVQNTKARFNELLNACEQFFIRHGEKVAALVLIEQWKNLVSAARHPTLKELLMSDEGRMDFEIPKRRTVKHRTAVHAGY